MQAFKYPSIGGCIQTTFQQEGLKGFYRGCGPVLGSVIFLRSAAFNIYTKIKSRLSVEDPLKSMVAGSITGGLMAVFGSPIDFIKVTEIELGTAAIRKATTKHVAFGDFEILYCQKRHSRIVYRI